MTVKRALSSLNGSWADWSIRAFFGFGFVVMAGLIGAGLTNYAGLRSEVAALQVEVARKADTENVPPREVRERLDRIEQRLDAVIAQHMQMQSKLDQLLGLHAGELKTNE